MAASILDLSSSELASIQVYDSQAKPEVNVTGDFGFPGVLSFYHVPNAVGDVANLVDEVKAWQSYEFQLSEQQVAGKIKTGELPTDNSTASVVKRTNYRAKVIRTLRSRVQTWLLHDGDDNFSEIITVKKGEAYSAIYRVLQKTFSSSPQQFSNFLHTIAFLIEAHPTTKLQFYFSNCMFKHGIDPNKAIPKVQASSFDVTQKVNEEDKDSLDIELNFFNHRYTFLPESWADVRPSIADIIEAGEKIRKRMSLSFGTSD